MPRTSVCLIFSLLTILTFCDFVHSLFDPISLSVIAGGAALSLYKRDLLKELTVCQFTECCIDAHIPADMTELALDLEANVYGQHIVHKQLMAALRSHYNHLDKSTKPFVLSFHGTPGTGKNYVADHIAKHLYRQGSNSTFIRRFMGRTDFPMESDVNYYRATLRSTVMDAVKKCPRSLFIFDEVDKIPSGVFEALTSLLDHHDNVDGVNLRHATFIFLSNTGGTEITDKLLDLTGTGMLREETQLFHFEKIAELAAYNIVGGLRKTSLIEANLIDHFIPFLPLEKRHIERCIISDFKRFGVDRPMHDDIEEISNNYVTYYQKLYSTSGCKRLTKKVAIYADKYK